jgi:hypothetical protein
LIQSRFALVLAAVFFSVPVSANAAPFVFPDRPELIFGFPEKTVESWFVFPDGIGFPHEAQSFSASSLGGGGGGSAGSPGSGTRDTSNDLEGPNVEDLPFDSLSSPFNIVESVHSRAAGPSAGYIGLMFFAVFPTEVPFQDVILNDEQTPNSLPHSPAPEPGSMLLVGAGLAGLLARRDYRRNA